MEPGGSDKKGPLPNKIQQNTLMNDASTLLMFSKVTKQVNPMSQPYTPAIQSTVNNLHEKDSKPNIDSEDSKDTKQSDSDDTTIGTSVSTKNETILPYNDDAVSIGSVISLAKEGIIDRKNGNTNINKDITATEINEPLKKDTEYLSDITEASRSKRKKTKWTVPDSYIVDPDAGVITCICGYNEDDGFTIQCDHCYRWQHAICYNIKTMDVVPDDYLCNVCQPRNVNIELAKEIQKRQFSKFVSDTIEPPPRSNSRKKRRTESVDSTGSNNSKRSTDNKQDTSNQTPPTYDPIRRKEHLLSAKEAYPAVYVSMNESSYSDRLIPLFLKKHKNDDFVIPYDRTEFTPLPTEVRAYSEIVYSRTFPGFNKLAVFITNSCSAGDLICENIGEIDFKSTYLKDPRNQYSIWGSPKRKVMFHSNWPLIIDQRLGGNEARYLRKSCKPNVELVTIRLPDNSIKFVYRALQDIAEGSELHAKWQWDKNHPLLQLINGTCTFEDMHNESRYILINSVNAILSSCECACGNNNKDCQIAKVRKIVNSLCKTIKARMNNKYKINNTLSQFGRDRKKRKPPILKRLITRNKIIEHRDISNIISSVHLEAGPTSETEIKTEQMISEKYLKTNMLPPLSYKLKLLNRGSVNHKIVGNINLLEYNEDNIVDPDQLEIPIEFTRHTEDTNKAELESIPSATSANILGGSTASLNSMLNDHKETNNQDYSNDGSNEVKPSYSHPGLTNLKDSVIENDSYSQTHQNGTARSKKKLSFADYRKKLNK